MKYYALGRLVRVLIRRDKQSGYIFNDLLLPLGEQVFTEVVGFSDTTPLVNFHRGVPPERPPL